LAVVSGFLSHLAFPRGAAQADGVFVTAWFYAPPLLFAAVVAFGAAVFARARVWGLISLASGVLLAWFVSYTLARAIVMSTMQTSGTLLTMGALSGALGALIVGLARRH
jgi:hypothetical protein